MLSFVNDYSEGAHPQVLAALEKNNLVTTCGYSMDDFCAEARGIVRARFSCPQADVHFMVGGTIANTTVIAAALRPWEGVIAATTGHINVHETGAIESSGHKVCSIEAPDGKLTPALVREVMRIHCDGKDEHMVLPRMVYISMRPSSARSIQNRSSPRSMMCAVSTDSIFSWTARECQRRWLPKETTSISRISENTATRFTSAARKTVFCSARPS